MPSDTTLSKDDLYKLNLALEDAKYEYIKEFRKQNSYIEDKYCEYKQWMDSGIFTSEELDILESHKRTFLKTIDDVDYSIKEVTNYFDKAMEENEELFYNSISNKEGEEE